MSIRAKLGISKRYILNQISRNGIVLLYHRVWDYKLDPQLLAVKPDHFYDQMVHLKRKYLPLEAEEYFDLFYRNRIPRRSVLLTFDDGYADNYEHARPILESLGLQATIFITTSKIGKQEELWWDELERIFLLDNPIPQNLHLNINNQSKHLKTNTKKDRLNTYNEMHIILKYSIPSVRDSYIAEMQDWAGINRVGRYEYRLVNDNEIKAMHRSKAIIVAAHTHNHPALSCLNYEEQLFEIQYSKTKLEAIIDDKVEYFSYPFGSRKDYNQDSIRIIKELKFKAAAANYYGHIHTWTSPFEYPRILIRDWKKNEFESQMNKFIKY
ncbi:MAG TPA: polysaccharide deacetylase family protein [Flavisolibacter sp.]|nr:polysaccharide deacetylase family protein [Flavisolibacter sp.]